MNPQEGLLKIAYDEEPTKDPVQKALEKRIAKRQLKIEASDGEQNQ